MLLVLFAGSLCVLTAGAYQLVGVERRMDEGTAEARSLLQLRQAGPERQMSAGTLRVLPEKDVLGILTFPDARSTETAVYEGTGDAALENGAGHAAGTAMPGKPGNCVLFGHRDSAFRPMEQLETGDPLLLETAEGVMEYTVRSLYVTTPEDAAVYEESDGVRLTLVTCYPFRFVGPAPKRYVAVAYMEAEAG